eukprot:36501_1
MATSTVDKTAVPESKPFDEHPFIWLNQWIIYCPMWTSSTIKNSKIVPRNKYVAKIGYYTLILICIAFGAWDIFQFFYQFSFNLFTLVAAISIVLTNISRLISFYYFFHCFQFYGLPRSHDPNSSGNINEADDKKVIDVMMDLPATLKSHVSSLARDQHDKLMKKTTIRFKVLLIWVIVACLVISVIQIVAFVNDNSEALNSAPLGTRITVALCQQVFSIIYIYFYQVPLFLAQLVLSIYYVRACAFIKDFTHRVNRSIGVEFDAAIEEYSTYRLQFIEKIKWLERLMLLRLASQVSWIWIDMAMIADGQSFLGKLVPFLWLSISSWTFLEMVMAGNDATHKFLGLHEKLYRIGTEKEYFSEVSVEHSKYLFLLDYVTTYPFVIQILAQEVSFRNAAKMGAAFVVARVVTYLFKAGLVSF